MRGFLCFCVCFTPLIIGSPPGMPLIREGGERKYERNPPRCVCVSGFCGRGGVCVDGF